MAKGKKTIEVELVKYMVNNFLLHSHDKLKSIREGHAQLLETILFETNNYHGCRYLDEKDMEKSEDGKSVGIIFNEQTGKANNETHQYPDPSRKFYF